MLFSCRAEPPPWSPCHHVTKGNGVAARGIARLMRLPGVILILFEGRSACLLQKKQIPPRAGRRRCFLLLAVASNETRPFKPFSPPRRRTNSRLSRRWLPTPDPKHSLGCLGVSTPRPCVGTRIQARRKQRGKGDRHHVVAKRVESRIGRQGRDPRPDSLVRSPRFAPVRRSRFRTVGALEKSRAGGSCFTCGRLPIGFARDPPSGLSDRNCLGAQAGGVDPCIAVGFRSAVRRPLAPPAAIRSSLSKGSPRPHTLPPLPRPANTCSTRPSSSRLVDPSTRRLVLLPVSPATRAETVSFDAPPTVASRRRFWTRSFRLRMERDRH